MPDVFAYSAVGYSVQHKKCAIAALLTTGTPVDAKYEPLYGDSGRVCGGGNDVKNVITGQKAPSFSRGAFVSSYGIDES